MQVRTLQPGELPTAKESGNPFLLTAAWAAWVLASLNTHNRKLKESVVERYTKEILGGTWQLTHQGLAFADDPVFLVDGQHRISGIAKSRESVVMRVFVGVSPNTQLVIDDHAVRSRADAFTLTGLPTTGREVAVANAMHAGPDGVGKRVVLPKTDLREFMIFHADAIRFACSRFAAKAKGITSASVVAVVGRAYYHADHETLKRFARVLVSGIPDPHDEAAASILCLRRHLCERESASGGVAKTDCYRKTQRMLSAYIDGIAMMKTMSSDKDLYPLVAQ